MGVLALLNKSFTALAFVTHLHFYTEHLSRISRTRGDRGLTKDKLIESQVISSDKAKHIDSYIGFTTSYSVRRTFKT